jgi:hypothetical protein
MDRDVRERHVVVIVRAAAELDSVPSSIPGWIRHASRQHAGAA